VPDWKTGGGKLVEAVQAVASSPARGRPECVVAKARMPIEDEHCGRGRGDDRMHVG
jgi:hypothetical protein